MAGHYPEHQGCVHVEATLTSNMLSHAKKEGSLHSVTSLRNITASLLKEVCRNIRTEPALQKLDENIG